MAQMLAIGGVVSLNTQLSTLRSLGDKGLSSSIQSACFRRIEHLLESEVLMMVESKMGVERNPIRARHFERRREIFATPEHMSARYTKLRGAVHHIPMGTRYPGSRRLLV